MMWSIILASISFVVAVLLVLKAIFMSNDKLKFYSTNKKNRLYHEKIYFIIKRVITLCYAGYILAIGANILINFDINGLILVGIIFIEMLIDRAFCDNKVE